MSDVVLYRKYRPQKFSEILGQDHIVETLQKAIKLGNVAHAYLFSGSRGTGKTTVARLLAQEIKCAPSDLNEMDGASNRGIDDIRALRDAVNMSPLESPYKVYIIDEVHMLTPPAFNALLKTLEEPPQHIVFVLATTELEKIPETIVSRCQSFVFKKPSQNILKKIVVEVATKEGFELENGAEDLVATLGDASFRDTLGILQKIISASSDKKISIAEVEKITGAPRGDLVNAFIVAIAEQDLDKGLEAVRKATENSIEMQIFAKLILRKIRAILLARFSIEMEKIIQDEFSEKDFEFLKKLSHTKDSQINANLILTLLEASAQIKSAFISQLPLELALIKSVKNVK